MQTFDDGQKGDFIKPYIGSKSNEYGYDPFLKQLQNLLSGDRTIFDSAAGRFVEFVKDE
jgi:hypothetical protein